MAQVSNTEVYGLDESIIASGYPMLKEYKESVMDDIQDNLQFSKHIKRADILANEKRPAHSNYLKWIIAQFDLTFSNKARVEAERYHFLDFVSSMSTMHRLTQMDLDKAFNEYVTPEMIAELKKLQEAYLNEPTRENKLRLLYNCPAWLELTARMTTNYMELRNIYHQRKNHQLPDWDVFCKWVETLPYSEWITWDNVLFEDNNLNAKTKTNKNDNQGTEESV